MLLAQARHSERGQARRPPHQGRASADAPPCARDYCGVAQQNAKQMSAARAARLLGVRRSDDLAVAELVLEEFADERVVEYLG
jgi:hypothetical protein